ncbi:hypothetical protein MIR68_004022 [Amoeboaphelidium protococcarum]|nr:hypothetical protein MIR68_004022 [Amoeboaphelidium protococcarum]
MFWSDWIKKASRGPNGNYQIFVLFLIAFPHITSQFYIVPFLRSHAKSYYVLYGWPVLFNLGCLMIYLCYYLACSTDPGSVPKDWSPITKNVSANDSQSKQDNDQDNDDDVALQHLVNQKQQQDQIKDRYCHRCRNYKPPRAHHCSTCRRCVLKMDHDCVWINNCVGFHNQAHFYRFLVYVVVTCSFLWWSIMYWFYDQLNEYAKVAHLVRSGVRENPVNMVSLFLACIDIFMISLVLLMVGMLWIYQTWYICTNTTTLETFEKDRVGNLVQRKKIPHYHFPYNVGLIENIRQVLGDNTLLWFYPFQGVNRKYDGLSFPIIINKERRWDSDGSHWPPAEYREYYPSAAYDDEYDSDDGELIISDTDNKSILNSGTVVGGYESPSQQIQIGNPRVRRGSEGYEIRLISHEEREYMVNHELS